MTGDERYPLTKGEKWFPGLWTITLGLAWAVWCFYDRDRVWESYPQLLAAWAILQFGGIGFIAWSNCNSKKWSLGSWVYRRRWRVVFLWCVTPAILVQVFLAAWVFIHAQAFFQNANGTTLIFPTFLATVSLCPLILLLWYIRDVNPSTDIRQDKFNQLQQDFHQLQKWACDENKPFSIRASAIHQLGRYLSGEIIDASNPQENDFQLPTMELFKAIVKDAKESGGKCNEAESGHESKAEKRVGLELFYKPKHIPIVEEIERVFQKLFARDQLSSFPQFPIHSLLKLSLKDTAFEGFNLSGLCYLDADLEGANLTGSVLTNAILKNADLTSTNLTLATLPYVILEGANLTGANLCVAVLTGANLTRANLTDAILTGADLEGANLKGANLTGADLEDANLEGVDLEGAMLRNANLEGAMLWRINLKNIQGWTQIKSIQSASLNQIQNAPKGFFEWAEEQGAVVLTQGK